MIKNNQKIEYISGYNDRVVIPKLKISTSILDKYIKSKNIKTLEDLDQKKIIDWIQEGGTDKILNIKSRNFEFFTNKIELLIDSKNNKYFFPWLYLCEIPTEDKNGKEYVYYKTTERKTFFNDEIIIREFTSIDFGNGRDKNKRKWFFILKPFIEKYGIFIGGFNLQMPLQYHFPDFTERFAAENYTIKKIIEGKERVGEKLFLKSLKQPGLNQEKKYWKWHEDFGIDFHDIPTDRFYETTPFKPFSRMIESRNKEQTKSVWDFFPQPINIIYKNLFGKGFGSWGYCAYCKAYFKKHRNDQSCCCPHHAKLARSQRYKNK
jgi:hypothetical protein